MTPVGRGDGTWVVVDGCGWLWVKRVEEENWNLIKRECGGILTPNIRQQEKKCCAVYDENVRENTDGVVGEDA
jgi:hypothetical protein